MAVCIVGLIHAGAPAIGSSGGQDRVDRFLDLILQAKSLDQVSRAYEREKFSTAEVKRIEAEVSKPAYRSKLAGLKPKLPPVKLNTLEVTKQAPEARGESSARTASKSISIPNAKPVPAKPSNVPAISQKELLAITSRPGGGTEARITRVDPSSFKAGHTLAISGSGFGRGRGSVEILLAGRRYNCDHQSWNDTAIRVTVPDYMASVIGSRERSAVLWVKLAGQSLGPTFDIRLEPTPTPETPAPKALKTLVIVEKEISTYVELDGSTSLGRTETFEILMGSQLANGWRIVSSRLERTRGSGTYEYILEPRAGTPELHQVIRINTSAFSDLRVASRMIIRGPQGTNYL